MPSLSNHCLLLKSYIYIYIYLNLLNCVRNIINVYQVYYEQ